MESGQNGLLPKQADSQIGKDGTSRNVVVVVRGGGKSISSVSCNLLLFPLTEESIASFC